VRERGGVSILSKDESYGRLSSPVDENMVVARYINLIAYLPKVYIVGRLARIHPQALVAVQVPSIVVTYE
jgi:hypothetical protein